MLSKLMSLFSKSSSSGDAPPADDFRIAIAALLVEAARVDEKYDAREQSLIEGALVREFNIDSAAASALRAKAEILQSQSADLHRYTKLAKTMPADDKIRFLESLWRIALSDGNRDPYEDALIRRLCGLIYVSDQESGAARRRIENELQG
ncbi:MAG: TerB family tellurite resistance protein [Amphiplicatus sp.]